MKSNGKKPLFETYDEAGDPRLMSKKDKSILLKYFKQASIPKKLKYYCLNPDCNNEIPEPRRCCNGQDCGCYGMPIDPPYCSEACHKIHHIYQKNCIIDKRK